MILNHLGLPVDKYYSPKVVYVEFSKLIESVGRETVFSQRKYQQDRELWIASLCTLGFLGISKNPLWVGYGKSQAPDAEIVSLIESDTLPGKGLDLHVINMEIMELDPHSALSFESELIKKLEKKYPAHFELLIFANQAGEYQHDDLVKIVRRHKPEIASIWFLGGSNNELQLWQLHPTSRWVIFNPVKAASAVEYVDILKPVRGTGY